MIDSLFILTNTGGFVVEKHFGRNTPRQICEPFLEKVRETERLETIPGVICTNRKNALVHILREKMIFLAVVSSESPPMAVFELLVRIYSVISRYLGEVSEDALRQNFSTVYLLLDEMIDSGYPFNTEMNTLESIIAPPTALTKVVSAVAGSNATILSDVAPNQKEQNTALVGICSAIGVNQSTTIGGASAEVWWRRQNVQYASNEIYVDIVERIDCIFDGGFHMVAGGVMGEIQINSKLSGMPEVSLSLKNPSVLQNASFHPCVRLHRFQRDKVLSFIPPDGEFTLVSYWIPDSTLTLPFTIGGEIKYHDDVAKMQFTAAPKLSVMRENNQMFIDKFCINVRVPNSIATGTLMTSTGNVRFDEDTKVAIWNIGKLQGMDNKVEGTLTYSTDKDGKNDIPSEEKSTAQLAFIVKGWSISGIRLDSCEITGVQYSPYKACRYTTSSGKMEFRVP